MTGFGKVLEWCLEVWERSRGGFERFWRVGWGYFEEVFNSLERALRGLLRGFGEDFGSFQWSWRGFGEVSEKFSRKGLEEAPSLGREAPRPRKGWEDAQKPRATQMRPRRLERAAKGKEKARKRPQSPAREGFGSSERSWRGFGEVFKGLGKVLKGFGEGFGSREAPRIFFPNGKRLKYKHQPPREQADPQSGRAPSCAGEP